MKACTHQYTWFGLDPTSNDDGDDKVFFLSNPIPPDEMHIDFSY